MAFTAGQKLRASELNNALNLVGYVPTDITATSNTTLADMTGFAVALEASTTYLVDGYLAYVAGNTGDIKLAFTVPTGTTGHWGVAGLDVTSLTSAGLLTAVRRDAFGDANTLALGGTNSGALPALACLVRAYVVIGGTAGTLQGRFAQNVSNATSSVAKAGSWLRAVKVPA